MKIGFDVSGLSGYNGINTYSRALIVNLVEKFPGDDFILFSTFSKSKSESLESIFGMFTNLEIKPVLPNPLALGNSLKPVVSLIRSALLRHNASKLDILHLTRPFAEKVKCDNLVLSVQDLFPLMLDEYEGEEAQKEFRSNASLMLGRAAAVIVPTDYIARQIESVFPTTGKKLHVIPHAAGNGFKISGEPPGITGGMRPGSSGYFLYVGSAYPRKNLGRLLESYNHLPETIRRNFGLVLVLTGVSKHIDNLKTNYSDFLETPGITILNGVSERELVKLYSFSTALLLPSTEEGFGLPVLEAMKCGCPVITSGTSCLPEVARDAALYVNPSDTGSISGAMRKLAVSPDTRKGLISAGLKRAGEFSWKKSAEQTMRVYLNLLK